MMTCTQAEAPGYSAGVKVTSCVKVSSWLQYRLHGADSCQELTVQLPEAALQEPGMCLWHHISLLCASAVVGRICVSHCTERTPP